MAYGQKFDGQTKNIKVSSMEQKPTKNGSIMTKLTDENGLKYSFFNTKKDGTPTAAAEAFQNIRLFDVVEIGFVEEEKEFQGDKGPIKYTQRTIRFAEKVEPQSDTVQMNPNGTYVKGHAPSLDDGPLPF